MEALKLCWGPASVSPTPWLRLAPPPFFGSNPAMSPALVLASGTHIHPHGIL